MRVHSDSHNVIVTGCLGALGSALCEFLARNYPACRIFGLDVYKQDCLPPSIHHYYQIDLLKNDFIYDVIEELFFAHPSNMSWHLVNNAGIILNDPIISRDFTKAEYNQYITNSISAFQVNTQAPIALATCFANHLVANHLSGSIVNISSICSKGNPGQSTYSASKAALSALSYVWSKELGPFQIRSNAILPGYIDTPSTNKAVSASVIKRIVSRIPLGKLGDQDSVSQAVALCIFNSYLNGAEIAVTGGFSI